MSIKKRTIIETNFLIQFFFHIFLFYLKYSKFNNQTSFMTFYNIILVVFIMSGILVLLKMKYSVNEILILILLFIFVFIQFVFLRDPIWISSFVSLIALKNFPLTETIKIMFYATLSALVVVLLLFYLGVIPEFTLVRDGVLRHSFGFSHPNFLGTILFTLFFQFFFVYGIKNKKFSLFFLVLLLIIINNTSGSRNSMGSLIAGYILIVLIQSKFLNKKILSISPFLLGVSFTLSYLAAKNYRYNSKFLVFLDKLLSGRIRLANLFYLDSPPNLFGNKLEMITTEKAQLLVGTSTKILDNAYMSILLKYGFILSLSLCLIYFFGLINLLKKKNFRNLAFVLVFIIFGFSESYFTFYEFNFGLIILVNQLLNHKRSIREL